MAEEAAPRTLLGMGEFDEYQLNRAAQQAGKVFDEVDEVAGCWSAEKRHRPPGGVVTVDLRVPYPICLYDEPFDLRSFDSEYHVTAQQLSGYFCRGPGLLFCFDPAALDEQRFKADGEVDEPILRCRDLEPAKTNLRGAICNE